MKISHSIDENGVLEIIIDNQEKRNSLDDQMIFYLVEKIQKNARLTVIRSKGKYFCSGRDISRINPENDTSMQPLQSLALAFRNSSQPILAIVEGAAIGLGVSIACWSDLCLSSSEAKFMIPESRIGIAPTITAQSLLEVIGRKRCLDMCLTGREITAQQAEEYGIVQYVSAPAYLDELKNEITRKILLAAPEAISISKSLINRLHEEAYVGALQLSADQALLSARSAVAREGVDAFRRKVKPSWVPKELV